MSDTQSVPASVQVPIDNTKPPTDPSLPDVGAFPASAYRGSLFIEIFAGRFKYFVYVALLCVIISTAIDFQHEANSFDVDRIKLIEDMKLPFWQHATFYSSIIRDIGFALIIALIISILVDRASHIEQNEFFSNALRQIGSVHDKNKELILQDVFFAVLKKRMPEQISSIIFETLVSHQFIRKDLYLRYKIDSLNSDDNNLNERFVSVSGYLNYNLENITQSEAIANIGLFMPFPAEPRLASFLKVISVTIGKRNLSADEIASGDKNLSDTSTDKRFSWTTSVSPGDSIQVTLSYKIVKEISDSDCWTSLASVTGGQYEVRISVPNLEWGVDALHSGSLIPVDGSSSGVRRDDGCVFNFDRALLPYQGVLLWWRPRR